MNCGGPGAARAAGRAALQRETNVRRRVLVLTRDLIPLPGRATSGGGLRAWGLGEALRLKGHDVVYSVPRKVVPEGEEYEELRSLAFEPGDLHTTLLRAEPDVLLVEQWGLATHLSDTSIPVILDLHGSLILENAFRRHRSLTSNAAAKIKALQKADLVICPGVRQRAYFMSWLMMSGADPMDIPVAVVPVSMPPEQPPRRADTGGPLSLVYGGQLWPWIDSGDALVAAAEVLEETGAGTLNLFVNEPERADVLPYDDSSETPAWHLPERVRSSDVVKLEGMIPHDAMVDRYTAAHLAVDLYAHNTERDLACTTRTVEYMWCGLPVVYGDYGELAGLIQRYEAGWIVSPGDGEAVRAAIREAVENRDELRRRGENASRLVREELLWDRTVEPLERFVQDPLVRDRGETIFGKLALEFDRIRSEATDRIQSLEQDLKRMVEEVENRESRIVSLTDEIAHHERLLEEKNRLLDETRQRLADREAELEADKRRLEEIISRQGVEIAEREREIRRLSSTVEELRSGAEDLRAALAEARDMLEAEQQDHGETCGRYEATRAELVQLQREKDEVCQELEGVKVDLKGAVSKIGRQAEAYEARIQELEERNRTLAQNELELRKDLGAEAARVQEIQDQVCERDKELEKLRQEAEELRRQLGELQSSWPQRALATGQHSLRRMAVQVPTVAGLFVRNLANNAYMTVWQKRHNVRIFPGQ